MSNNNMLNLQPGDLCKLTSNTAVFIGFNGADSIFIPVSDKHKKYVILEIGFIIEDGTRLRKYLKAQSEFQIEVIRSLPSEPVEIIGKINQGARIAKLAYHLILDPNNVSQIIRKNKREVIDTINYHRLISESAKPFYKMPWVELKLDLFKKIAEPGMVYQFENSQELAVLVYCGQGKAIWMPIYTMPIDPDHRYEKRSEIAIHLISKTVNYECADYWIVFEKEKLQRTSNSVLVRYFGKIAEESLAQIRRMLQVKRPVKVEAENNSAPQIDSQLLAKAGISIDSPIINVQEVYELVKKYPQFENAFTTLGKCPFKAGYFVFRDQCDQVNILSIDPSGHVKGINCPSDIHITNFVQLIFGFLNSRNTTCEPYGGLNLGDQTEKAKTSPLDMLQYKVLHINPVAKRKQYPSSKESVLNSQPARLVRGHFATYSADKPLFRKPWGVGTYWIGPHVSGNPEFGIVMKDYYIDLKEFLKSIEQMTSNQDQS